MSIPSSAPSLLPSPPASSEAEKERQRAQRVASLLSQAAEKKTNLTALQPEIDVFFSVWDPVETYFAGKALSAPLKARRLAELSQKVQRSPGHPYYRMQRAEVYLQCDLPLYAAADCLQGLDEEKLVEHYGDEREEFVSLLQTLSLYGWMANVQLKTTDYGLTQNINYSLTRFQIGSERHAGLRALFAVMRSNPPGGSSPEDIARSVTPFFLAQLQRDPQMKSKECFLAAMVLKTAHILSARDREKETMYEQLRQHGGVPPGITKEAFKKMHFLSEGCQLLVQRRRERSPAFVLQTLNTLRGDVLHSVDVVADPHFGGFKMVAKRDIAAGKVFLTEHAVAALNRVPNCCSTCGLSLPVSASSSSKSSSRLSPSVLSCSRCGRERYCSAECQEKASQGAHSVICASSAAWNNYLDEVMELPRCHSAAPFCYALALQMLLEGMARGVSPLQWPQLQILHRPTDGDDIVMEGPETLSTVTSLSPVATAVQHFSSFRQHCPDLGKRVSAEDFLSLLTIISCNSFCNTGMRRDIAIYCAISFVNHDCVPNAGLESEGLQGKLVAKRRIKVGEDITISYADITKSYGERQALLKAMFDFECRCTRCEREKPK